MGSASNLFLGPLCGTLRSWCKRSNIARLTTDSDILVIGAGPAGAVAATLLARGGRQVSLIDANRFPRHKVCGECLSALGIATLEAAGMGDVLRDLRPTTLSSTILYADSGRSVKLSLPHPMAGVTRMAMDMALLGAAESAGVHVRQSVRATKVTAGEHPSVQLATAEARETWTSNLVILADGKGTLAGATALPADLPERTGDVGIKSHYTNIDLPINAIHLFGVRGHYAGLAAVSDGAGSIVWNLACNVPAARLKAEQGDINKVFADMCSENAALGRAMASGERAGNWLASPLPRFSPRPVAAWPKHVIPIGNAAAALEPVGGEGMGLAMASARMAAGSILHNRPLAELHKAYCRLWRTRRFTCRSMAMMLSRPRVARATVMLARMLPPVASGVMRLAGKRQISSVHFAPPPPALS